MRLTITLVTLTAIVLGIVHFANARVCKTECYPANDGSGGQRCTTWCF